MRKTEELTARGFLKKLIGFSMASWLSAAISFAITPIFTRLYVPEEAGHINLFITYMTFFQTVCIMALDQAFMRFYNEDLEGLSKDNFLRYCLRINLSIAVVVSIIILMGYRYFSEQISGEYNCQIPICLVIVIISSAFLRMSSISSRMQKNVLQYTVQVLLTSFSEKVIITLVAFWYPSHKTAILAMTVCYACFSLIFLVIKLPILKPARKVPWETTKTILKFSIPYLPVLILAWLNNSIPLLVLKKYVDYSSVGIYTNAVTMANILTIIQTGFSAYWEPFIYEHYKDDHNKEKVQKIERSMVWLLIFMAISIVLFQDIIYLLVGEKYRASKIFFPLLMLTPICNSAADMTGIGIKLAKKNYLNIFAFIGNTSVNLVLSYILVPRIGIMGAGIAVGASALVMLAIRSYLGRRYYKINENNGFIIFSLVLMCAACVVNALIAEQIVKYSLLAILLLALCILFRREIIFLLKFAIREVRSMRICRK